MLAGLVCPQCQKSFNSLKRKPRMIFKCGHTFCESCLDLFLTHNQQQFTCPLDNKEIPLQNQTINDFPINQTLLQFVSENKQQNTSTIKDPSENQIDQIEKQITKGNCNLHHKKKDGICLTCTQIVCVQCSLFNEHQYLDLRHFIKQGLAINEEMLLQKDNIKRIEKEITETYFKFEILPGIVESKRKIKEAIDQVKKLIDEKFEEDKNQVLEKVDQIWEKFEKQFRQQLKQENFGSRIGLWVERSDEMNIESEQFEEKFQKMIDLQVNDYGLKHISTAQEIMNDVLEVQDKLTIGFEDFKSHFTFEPNIVQVMIKSSMPQVTFESNLINENLDQNILQDENEDLRELDDIQNVSNSRNFLKKGSRNTSQGNHAYKYSQDPGFFQNFRKSQIEGMNDSSRRNSQQDDLTKHKIKVGSMHLDLGYNINQSDDKSEENMLLRQESIPVSESLKKLDQVNLGTRQRNIMTDRLSNVNHRKQSSYLNPMQGDDYNFPKQFSTQAHHVRNYSHRNMRRQTQDNDNSQSSIYVQGGINKKDSFMKKPGQFSGKKLPSLSPIPRDKKQSVQKKEFQRIKKSLQINRKVPQLSVQDAIQAIKSGAKKLNLSDQNTTKLATLLNDVKELDILDISNTQLTDKGFYILTKKFQNIKLKKLIISGNNISFQSLKRLCNAAIISGSLEKIVARNVNLTKDQIKVIQNDFKNTKTKIYL